MSQRGTGRQRTRLSRAEIKAYEARRAAERARISSSAPSDSHEAESSEALQHSYSMTRDDEFLVIKSDLIRLLWIVGVLLVVLVAASFYLG